jgi:hypothetical protein
VHDHQELKKPDIERSFIHNHKPDRTGSGIVGTGWRKRSSGAAVCVLSTE